MLIQVNLSNDLDTTSCNIEVEYLSCLKHLSSLISDKLNEEIKRVKIELSQSRKSKS
ncbi:hypothetical protein AAG906_005364 [Vitis piasezkii]